MSEQKLVVQICGPYPENFEPVQILSDKIYIFENDPNYSAVKVFDIDKNSVFVNSFKECEHYVSGGWSLIPDVDFIPGQETETILHYLLLFFAATTIFVGFIYIKKFIRRNL